MNTPDLSDIKRSLTQDKKSITRIKKGVYASWFLTGYISISMPLVIFLSHLSLSDILRLALFYFPIVFIGSIGLLYIHIRNMYIVYCARMYSILEEGLYRIDDIDSILRGSTSIYRIIPILKLIQFFDTKLLGNSQILSLELQIQYLLKIIYNLRSDLTIRLTEQQQTLESAKSEVEKNIQGTTELEQISELQRARLDRQIEQFEELQRVLVKV